MASVKRFKGLSDVKSFYDFVRREGLSRAVSIAIATLMYRGWQIQGRRFDRKHGVDTAGFIDAADLKVEGAMELGNAYVGTFGASLKKYLKRKNRLPKDLSEWHFIDFGSGKGRVLLIASEYPFASCIGVEYARDLHDLACSNIRSYRSESQKCAAIQSICIDATQFQIPDGRCLFYLVNPFGLQTLNKVLDNIELSLRKAPRETVAIYVGPHEHAFHGRSMFRRVYHRGPGPLSGLAGPDYAEAVYETPPS